MADIIIVGAGPAGGSAAIFAAKAGKETIVLDSGASMTKRAWMENHYGSEGISGPDLLMTGRKQAEKYGALFYDEKVTQISSENGQVTLSTESGKDYVASHVILTTGANPELAANSGIRIIEGREPRIKSIIEVDRLGRTSMPGVWAAGVVAGVSVHTIVTSGDGARVAIEVLSELNGERYVDHDVLR
ncbi:FAD-dependent oxidoreductase [Neobacillus mesonae]|nr:FAD-dependent oxidoreductase [Neobacillus mesonae]